MALTGITWGRVVAATTANETATLTPIIFENGTSFIRDLYGTINSAARLYERVVETPEVSGGMFRTKFEFYRYTNTYDNTYSHSNLAAATASPFSLAEGVIYQTIYSEWQDLDAAHTAAGDART